MQLTPPTSEEYSVLVAQHAQRFPEKRTIVLPGDHGTEVRIPVVIGNPSGASKLAPGQLPSTAWSQFIAASFGMRYESVALVRQAAADCLLWPSALVWSQVVERWPGAPDPLWDACREKCGASLGLMGFPAPGDQPPAPVAAVLDKFERAVWRRLSPPGAELLVVIDAPKSTAWAFFSDAMKKDDADRWKLVGEMAQMAVPAAWRVTPATMQAPEQYESIDFVSDVVPRWPGFAVHVTATLGQLAGVRARVDRDGW